MAALCYNVKKMMCFKGKKVISHAKEMLSQDCGLFFTKKCFFGASRILVSP
jgi:hypothetical protein